MKISRWLDLDSVSSLLDVGCHVGALLRDVRKQRADIELAGVEVNRRALENAQKNLPSADLREAAAEKLPFSDARFDRVTCIEVLEHVPENLRRQALEEMHRVLRPGGKLLLQVPHAGAFAWLDPSNFRFRFPTAYRLVVGRGLRQRGDLPHGIVWHHHFTLAGLEALTRDLFTTERVHLGGLFLMPLSDIARWPWYRLGKASSWPCRTLQRVSAWDLQRDYGSWAYDVRLLLTKI